MAHKKSQLYSSLWQSCDELRGGMDEVLQSITRRLVDRLRELHGRYARPLPELERDVEKFAAKIAGHLGKMSIA